MELRTLHDIYRCPHCGFIAARGDYHCRSCGMRFSEKDIDVMENNIRTSIGATPWNVRDRYRCVHCSRFVSIQDRYCRGCGDEIEDHERKLMRLRLSELAEQNKYSLIGLGVFILLVIWVLIKIVR